MDTGVHLYNSMDFHTTNTRGCFLAFARQPYIHLKLFDAGHAVVLKYVVEHGLSKRCHLPDTPAECKEKFEYSFIQKAERRKGAEDKQLKSSPWNQQLLAYAQHSQILLCHMGEAHPPIQEFPAKRNHKIKYIKRLHIPAKSKFRSQN